MFFLYVSLFFFLICCLSVPSWPAFVLSFLWNQYFYVLIHSSLSHFTLQPSLSVSSSLFLHVSAIPLLYLLSSLSLIWYSLCSFSPPREFSLVLFYLCSSSSWQSFCFRCSHFFFLLERCSSHAEWSFPHLPFKSLNFFFLCVCLCPLRKSRYRALGKVRQREQAEQRKR